MGSLFPGEKYTQLYIGAPRTGSKVLLGAVLALVILLPTIGEPNHLVGFAKGMGYAMWISIVSYLPRLIDRHIVKRLSRSGDTMQVELRSFPGFPRSFSCPLRDAYAWQLVRNWRGALLVFHHQGRRYVVPLGRGNRLDARAMFEAYPELGPLAF
jgi:hypothetical protein